jgi:hypothetical protein
MILWHSRPRLWLRPRSHLSRAAVRSAILARPAIASAPAASPPSPLTACARLAPGLRGRSVPLDSKMSPLIRLRSGGWLSGGNTGSGGWIQRKLE